jgi:hypothetical protein
MAEIILLIILLITGLGSHFISVEVKRLLMPKGNTIATFFSATSFFVSTAIICFALFYAWLALGLMCVGM